MKHIGIFANSGAVATAIENELLLNPYVAMVSGVLDYNSVQPTPPAPVIPSEGLAVLTSDGYVYVPNEGDSDEYGGMVEFTKPYDSTFTVYWNGQIAEAGMGDWYYQRCAHYEEESAWYEWTDCGSYEETTTLEDLDYGTAVGETGDTVDVHVEYYPAQSDGCGDEGDEPCPPEVYIVVSNENCYECEGIEDEEEKCGCAGGDWVEGDPNEEEGSYCDCQEDPECDCKMSGGYWNGEECIYPDCGGGE